MCVNLSVWLALKLKNNSYTNDAPEGHNDFACTKDVNLHC